MIGENTHLSQKTDSYEALASLHCEQKELDYYYCPDCGEKNTIEEIKSQWPTFQDGELIICAMCDQEGTLKPHFKKVMVMDGVAQIRITVTNESFVTVDTCGRSRKAFQSLRDDVVTKLIEEGYEVKNLNIDL